MPALSTLEIRLLKETARRFAESSLRPQVARRSQDQTLSNGVLRAFAELGFGLVAIPKDMGGLAMGPLAMSLVTEAMAAGDVNMAFALPQPGAFGEALVRLGNPVQRARFGHAFRVSPTRTWGSFAFCPADEVQAAPLPDGAWCLNGQLHKVWHLSRADRLVLILPTTHDHSQTGPQQLAVVLPLPYPGLTVGEPQISSGLPLAAPASLTLTDVHVPQDQVLQVGDLQEPLAIMCANMDLALASMALGAARAASAYVLGFAEERRQAGSPLAHFHSMGFLLVDMHLACEAALKRVREAAAAAQASALGVHFHRPTDVVDLGDLISGIAAARSEAEEVAFFVTDSAVQILDDGQEKIDSHPISAWHQDVQQLAQTYRRPTGI